jgi:glycosyltransferase involved in cell wall biosynthesis
MNAAAARRPGGASFAEPRVSIVTPVYNGEKYLRECIESVLAQTYTNWEYIIVNNRSTDRSLEIAQAYAERDGRIRIHNNSEFVGVSRNHNIAFGLMSAESAYCKPVHADDWLFPECIARMVETATAHPSVGVVGSYTLANTRVECYGVPYHITMMPGRELCRLTLLGELYVFWAPSCLMFRSDVIRAAHGAFYNEAHIYGDDEACFEALQRTDFAFVHQVLSYVRTHDESLTATRAQRINTFLPAWLDMLTTYGPACLSDDEYQRLLRRKLQEYYRFLGKSIFRLRDRQFWRFHEDALTTLGFPFSWTKVIRASLSEGLNAFLYPAKAVGRAVIALKQQRGPTAA